MIFLVFVGTGNDVLRDESPATAVADNSAARTFPTEKHHAQRSARHGVSIIGDLIYVPNYSRPAKRGRPPRS